VTKKKRPCGKIRTREKTFSAKQKTRGAARYHNKSKRAYYHQPLSCFSKPKLGKKRGGHDRVDLKKCQLEGRKKPRKSAAPRRLTERATFHRGVGSYNHSISWTRQHLLVLTRASSKKEKAKKEKTAEQPGEISSSSESQTYLLIREGEKSCLFLHRQKGTNRSPMLGNRCR